MASHTILRKSAGSRFVPCVATHIPNHHRSLGPLDSRLEISTEGDMIVEEFEQSIAFLLLVPDDMAGDLILLIQSLYATRLLTLRVDKKGFLPSRRMGPHKRMYTRHWLPTDCRVSSSG